MTIYELSMGRSIYKIYIVCMYGYIDEVACLHYVSFQRNAIYYLICTHIDLYIYIYIYIYIYYIDI